MQNNKIKVNDSGTN